MAETRVNSAFIITLSRATNFIYLVMVHGIVSWKEAYVYLHIFHRDI